MRHPAKDLDVKGAALATLVTGDPLTLDLLMASAAVAVGIGLMSR